MSAMKKDTRPRDARVALDEKIRDSRFDRQSLSIEIDKKRGYLSQFIKGGSPQYLSVASAMKIGQRLQDLEWRQLISDEDMAALDLSETNRAKADGATQILELNVVGAAGGGSIVETETVSETWRLPNRLIETLAIEPETARLITVRGDSMAPTLSGGDRVLVDTRSKAPTPPGLFVVYDGMGLLIKRIEAIPGDMLRITSDNPTYASYDLPIGEVDIKGRVVWSTHSHL